MDQLIDQSEGIPPEMAEMLPDEVRQLLELQEEQRLERIESFGRAIGKKRDEAVSKRKSSGIESEWEEDTEYYEGIDDANRDEAKVYKPSTMNGSFIAPRKNQQSRSTVFLNITRPYVDAGAARIGDMLLPTDERNWAIKPTPKPKGVQLPQQMPQQMPMQMPAGPQAQQMMPGQEQPMPMGAMQPPMAQAQPPVDMAKLMEQEAGSRAEAAQERIDDWLVQCQYHAEVRKVFDDMAKLGTGVLKGPFPVKRKRTIYSGNELRIEQSIDPASVRVDPWNLYPDPACGESIHNGSYVFEYDEISVRKLRDLKGLPGYLNESIDQVIEEGPNKSMIGLTGKDTVADDTKFGIWYYHGIVDRDDMEAMGIDLEDTALEGVPAILTLVNETVIRAALNPLDTGGFPYDVINWQRRVGHWAGIGIARQIRTAQRMLNAATRNMMDNAGLSGGPQIVFRRNVIEPADGNWELSPRKFWYAREDADIRAINDAIMAINIPSLQGELTNIIQFALKMAEDSTGLPMLLQGQQGQAPDTVGGMTMMQNNASGVLRRIAKHFDDNITEPHIRRYYDWLMQYGEEEEKGDFQIDARGSSALVERDIANQAILQMGAMVMNPAFGINPKKWFEEACRAQRLDPKKFQFSDEEMAQMQAQQQPPPPPPQVMAAEIRAKTEMQKTQMQLQAEMQQAQMEYEADMARTKRDTDRDAVYVQAETQRTQAEHVARMRELEMKLQLAQLDYAAKHQLQLEDVKRSLAETTMKLQTTKELAMLNARSNMMPSPPVEPPGRAPAGQSFQK